MKKLLAMALALALILSIAACGGKDDDKPASSPAPASPPASTPAGSAAQTPNLPPALLEQVKPEAGQSGGDRTDWNYADYAQYTGGVPAPPFAYTVSGLLNDQFSFKSEATADEIGAWKQTLLDNGAEEVREGETWAVIDGRHLIEMNGITNGVAYFYISLDDRPVSGKPAAEAPAAPAGEDTVVQKANALAVSFGSYNGKPIAWRVLDVDTANERALLITEECLDEVQFHEEAPEDLTYRTSDLRVWLTGDFHYSSFTDEEKARIIEVTNPQDTNSETGAREPEGYETTDTVFILSATEMKQYFADDEDMAGTLGGEHFSYWTRTPGNDTTGYVCTYSGYGGLYMTGNQADSTGVAVRPAIWVDLSGEAAGSAAPASDEAQSGGSASASPTGGPPEGWPDNEYTRLVPTPAVGGKVLTSGEIGALFAIELKWEMEQGVAYAQQLQEAGFGEDCVEKYEKQGYLDRTVDGVNVQLMDVFGTTSLTIMKAE